MSEVPLYAQLDTDFLPHRILEAAAIGKGQGEKEGP